jgi:sugar phosphate isomerase/epimerase
MSDTRIAAQLWTVRQHLATAEDFAASMKRLAEIGYRAVQVNWPIPFPSVAELKKVLDDNGLACCATHYPADAFLKDVGAVIDEHLALDCSFPGVGGAPKNARSAKGIARFGQQMTEVCAKLTKNNMRFVYHNHHWEFQRHEGVTWLETLFEESCGDFTFELDLYWVQAGGCDPVKWIRKCEWRCPVLHFKDMGVEGHETVDLPVGDGNLDWPAILEAARASGTQWYVVEEDHAAGDDGFASLARSLENLNAMGVT